MRPQPLWRGHVSIVEEVTGFYTVRTDDRHEHGAQGEHNVYKDLCWEEALDVIDQYITTSGERRIEEHRRIIGAQWTQLSLYELPGTASPG